MPCRNAEYDAMNYHTRKRVAYHQENMGIFGATQLISNSKNIQNTIAASVQTSFEIALLEKAIPFNVSSYTYVMYVCRYIELHKRV